jgi:protein TonB
MRLALPLALGLHGAVLAALLAWPTATPPEPDEPPAMRVELAAVIGTGHDTAPAPQEARPEPEPPQEPPPPQAAAPPPPPPAEAPPLPPVPEEVAMPPPPAPPAPRAPPRPPAPRPAPPTTRPVLPMPQASEPPPAFTAALVPDREARAAYTPAVPYPPDARNRRQHGLVVVRIDIGADGLVTRVTLVQSSGVASLDQAVMETVQRWRFDPALRGGRPVPDAFLQRVTFRPN